MRRRDFIGAIYAAAVALPFAAAAQQPSKVWRIGQVLATPPEVGEPYAQALEQRLADLGYVPGRNVVLLDRFTGAQTAKIEEAIISLLPQIDLLVLWGNAATVAKKLAEGAPTVFISVGYPVELGLVQSLAHPGGNMTGIAAEAALEINGKRLQILKEIVPDVNRVAVLRDVAEPTAALWSYGTGFEWTAMNQAARQLGLSLLPIDVKSADDLEAAFADMKKSGAEAVFLTRTALVFNAGKQIADPQSRPISRRAIPSGRGSWRVDWSASTPIGWQWPVRPPRKSTRSSKGPVQPISRSSSPRDSSCIST
jgi:putative tryptophan/tyrosine transport system substrate-binding protein